MNQQNTVESRVLSILKDCPRARFDDMILIMHYYNRYLTSQREAERTPQGGQTLSGHRCPFQGYRGKGGCSPSRGRKIKTKGEPQL